MYLFLDFTQSNLNFEPSFVGIDQVLREIWLSEHEFHTTNFGQLSNFETSGIVSKNLYLSSDWPIPKFCQLTLPNLSLLLPTTLSGC